MSSQGAGEIALIQLIQLVRQMAMEVGTGRRNAREQAAIVRFLMGLIGQAAEYSLEKKSRKALQAMLDEVVEILRRDEGIGIIVDSDAFQFHEAMGRASAMMVFGGRRRSRLLLADVEAVPDREEEI